MSKTIEPRDDLAAARSARYAERAREVSAPASGPGIAGEVDRSDAHELAVQRVDAQRESRRRPENAVIDDRGPALVSVPEAARLLGISRASAYRYADAGLLPGVRRLGRRVYVVRARLIEFLEAEHDGAAGADAA